MLEHNIKPTHKPIKNYYAELEKYAQIGEENEGTVRTAFQTLLQYYCGRANLTLLSERTHYTTENRRIQPDGEVVDTFGLNYGHYEAKDTKDNLPAEVDKKLAAGYPSKNILFQSPERAILYQHGHLQLDLDITAPKNLVQVLQTFFAYQAENITEWHAAISEFKEKVPALGEELAVLIQTERLGNPHFQKAFTNFHRQCQASINPDLSIAAVEEMLIQHLLTERIFATIFKNRDFTRRNIIASEIEKVIDVLTEQALNRDQFLQSLDRFYAAIEKTAAAITDYSQKQGFLNTVYEQFFQGFSVKVADTHGIVYTPQPIVDFMVNSVEHLLKMEFDRSLSDTGVHIIDPFVGTGNFIVRLMQDIQGTALEHKYRYELHCNEILLLPYYIATLNIEHEYFQRAGTYLSFEGVALADTFELLEQQPAEQYILLTPENTERVEKQKATDMFVVIGNPPYNMGQVNENDNNKNRKYEVMDARIKKTYAADSTATLKNKLYDPYVKAIRWGLDRIDEEGIVAFVTNNSFLDGVAFDGMRKHLLDDCDAIYILDLGGNARKGLKVSDANVFGIRVGVSINLFVKKKWDTSEKSRIFYYRTDDLWNGKQKFDFLNERQHIGGIDWQPLQPDTRHTWLTEGLHAEFDTFMPMGTKEAKSAKGDRETIFRLYSCGVVTSRDNLVYSFELEHLQEQVQTFIEIYNTAVDRKRRHDPKASIEDFIDTNDPRIKWSHRVKQSLKKLELGSYEDSHFRAALYRPFCQQYLYFNQFWNERRYQQHRIFPTPETENRIICASSPGTNVAFHVLIGDVIPDYHFTGDTQCFPFYTYDEDGTNRKENITDWALAEFRKHYGDDALTKWDIFHYTYGILHHPGYQEKYAVNLKRDLPHIPFVEDFYGFANAGAQLADLHGNYESQPEYDKLKLIQNPNVSISWRVEKMKLSKDKTSLLYNDFLTLDGIPEKVFDYRLGTRSALEWILNQYCVKADKRIGIITDPNRADDARYIVRLIGQVITVSLETLDIVEGLPGLEIR